MQTKTLDLAPQAAEVARVVAGVRDDQLTAPTPNADMPVAGLLDHLVGLTYAFRLTAEKRPLSGAPRASAEDLPADWRTRLLEQLNALVAAWREPAAWEGVAEAGGARMPAGAMGVVALNEILVHGWDLAVATGQQYRADPASAQACLDFAVDFASSAPEARNGIYGPVVEVRDDAPVFDRLLGWTGRDPGWRPTE
jgi:uncharacterized protein (TIGR03086 family)